MVGDYIIKFHVCSKVDSFDCAMVAVYGAAQLEFKSEFLSKLVRICGVGGYLILFVGGRRKIMISLMVANHLCSMQLLRIWTRENSSHR